MSVLGFYTALESFKSPDLTLYTAQDIIYVSGHHIESEAGIDTMVYNVSEYLEGLTAEQSYYIDDLELHTLLRDYTTIIKGYDSYTLVTDNPYSNNRVGIEMNMIEEYPEDFLTLIYFQD